MSFILLDEASVILIKKGIYSLREVYVRDGRLYAKVGAGFVRLGGSSIASAGYQYEALQTDEQLEKGKTGEPLIKVLK